VLNDISKDRNKLIDRLGTQTRRPSTAFLSSFLTLCSGSRERAIPKSVDIEDFVGKLELLCKRLNWSRAKLAQQVGIDKSLASRWLAGGHRPTGNSLMRLNDVLARALPGFTAASWDLGRAALAEKFGIETGASSRGVPPVAPGSMPGGQPSLARFRQSIDHLAPIFCGTYDAWNSEMTNTGGIVHRYIRISRRGDGLHMEGGSAHTSYQGECYVVDRRLHAVVESPAFATPSMILVGGAYGEHPGILSGFMVTEMRAMGSGWIAAVPLVLRYIQPLSGEAAADDAAWQALKSKMRTFAGDKEIRRHVPAKIAALVRSFAGARQPDGTTDTMPIIRPLG